MINRSFNKCRNAAEVRDIQISCEKTKEACNSHDFRGPDINIKKNNMSFLEHL